MTMWVLGGCFFRNISRKTSFIRNITSIGKNQTNPGAIIKDWDQIPGPPSLPFVGIMHNFFPGGSLYKAQGYTMYQQLYDLYGPIVKLDATLGRRPILFIYDPEATSMMIRGEELAPYRNGFMSLKHYRNKYSDPNKTTKATGLLTDQGDVWKQFRQAVNSAMLQPRTIKLYASEFDKVTLEMISRLKSKRNIENMIPNFDTEINLWALESIGTIALGCRLHCFDSDVTKDSPSQLLIDSLRGSLQISSQLDFSVVVLWPYFPTPMYKKAMKYYAEQERMCKYFINIGIERILKQNNKPEDQKGVLEKILEINKDYAYLIASDMLFGGVDTISTSIISALYLLATNPEAQKKLRQEVNEHPEKRPYLKACLKETFRLFSITPGISRTTTKDYNVLGYKVPKDTLTLFVSPNMCMMEKHYPRAKEFIPERWLVDKNDPLYYGNTHPFVFLSFGFGVRSCIGRRIAELEIETFLSRFIENFELEWCGPPPTVSAMTINYINGPLNFIIKDVQKQ